jgi:hypothetical protein
LRKYYQEKFKDEEYWEAMMHQILKQILGAELRKEAIDSTWYRVPEKYVAWREHIASQQLNPKDEETIIIDLVGITV